jgi:hypothetical protein
MAFRLMQHYTLPLLGIVALLLALYAFTMYIIKKRLNTQFLPATGHMDDSIGAVNRRNTRKLIEV